MGWEVISLRRRRSIRKSRVLRRGRSGRVRRKSFKSRRRSVRPLRIGYRM